MMTKQLFYEFVKSFKKNPGEYTEDEIFEICEAHKDLISGKSWSEVVDLLGVNKTPDALRSWTYRKEQELAKEGVLKTDLDAISACTCEQNAVDITPAINESLYIEKTKVRDSYNAFRRGLRDEARIESFKESIENAVDKLRPLPFITFEDVGVKKQDKEAILMLSDLHIGAQCDNYYNKYNSDIAASRLQTLALSTIEYCKLNNVKKLHILNMGDMIHGIIHTSARLEQELDLAEQIIEASELLSEFMNLVQRAAPIVTYRSVIDNHSRAVANYKEHIEKENFGRVIDWALKRRLANTKIEFLGMDNNLDLGVGMFTLDCGKKVVFAHGHEDSINNGFQNFIGMTREWIDYILLAHYHSAKQKEYQGATVIVNGSIVGTEQYAFKKRLFAEPSQTLLILDEQTDINIKIKL